MTDWQVGDLAVCVCEPIGTAVWKPCAGSTYTVSDVGLGDDDRLGLDLAEDPDIDPDFFWDANDFRKLDKREACEPEFVTLLNRIKRKVSA